MAVGLCDLLATRGATMRGIPQIHFGFGVDGDEQGILAVIRRSVDLLKVAETCPGLSRRDGVRFLGFFSGLAFCARRWR